ncbi:dTDP-4-dehydrorhamnose reductase [Luteibacter rhizovicinus]|uniref:dTDP-4-dehydrorhamnose reductase n=1 Tax=Luteibacter sp. dw_328 TaxID=2719796 RepID=UPI0007BFA3A9|nr:dTDP-4-dehydrorhamnose reductase [Luteibacter rhizovicinus]
MKFLLLGANGQLGQTFLSQGGLADRGELVAATRDGSLANGARGVVGNLADPTSLEALLETERPDVIVNAAAYTAVDKAESDEVTASLVNGHALGILGDWAARHGAMVIHYSTDYVFDGEATTPYTEDATVAPAGAYGRSKLVGEGKLRDSGAAHFIFRTAWVYSSVGHNFLRTMLRLGADRDQLAVVADQQGTPTDTGLIVDATLAALDRWVAEPSSRGAVEGTYHLTATGTTTWHGFAEAIFDGAVTRGLLARPPVVKPIATAEFPTPARRPSYSVLDNRRFAQTFGFDFPTWRAGVEKTLAILAQSNGITIP